MTQFSHEQIGEHETKFVLPNTRARGVIAWLTKRCQPDPQYATGQVSSIYYDTRDWAYLDEKINSDYLKTKVRVRWYGDSRTGRLYPTSFLEVKSKIGSARKKIRIRMEVDSHTMTQMVLHDPAWLHLPRLAEERGVFLKKPLLPTFQLNYQRFRFVDPLTGSRLCVDYNIHVSRINPVMIQRMNPVSLDDAVFELKGKGGHLPDWLHQLTSFGCRRGAFSKYSGCYAQLKRITF